MSLNDSVFAYIKGKKLRQALREGEMQIRHEYAGTEKMWKE